MDDLEHFVTNITPRRNYHVGQKLDGTKSLVRLDDYFLLPFQHTDGTHLYIDKKTSSNIDSLTAAFTAYKRKYHQP